MMHTRLGDPDVDLKEAGKAAGPAPPAGRAAADAANDRVRCRGGRGSNATAAEGE